MIHDPNLARCCRCDAPIDPYGRNCDTRCAPCIERDNEEMDRKEGTK